eukprot:NODE_5887_length_899_cov_154.099227_g5659_i0.p1 GENE.NODE_5887_length_899_cov_154.099227_g5659_i0~~NODE_5887_length_899_cov_154.099227_g5659_i0.p1  ORF type:complete len:211 (+),score=36.40 NODE_5887_length_899_cov_154.099227_g5659_i0:52-633(+)
MPHHEFVIHPKSILITSLLAIPLRGTGDLIAQTLEIRMSREAAENCLDDEKPPIQEYSAGRVLRHVGIAALYMNPVVCVTISFAEFCTPSSALGKALITLGLGVVLVPAPFLIANHYLTYKTFDGAWARLKDGWMDYAGINGGVQFLSMWLMYIYIDSEVLQRVWMMSMSITLAAVVAHIAHRKIEGMPPHEG